MDSNCNQWTHRSSADVDRNTPMMNRGRPQHTDLDGYNDSYGSGPLGKSGSGQPLGGRYRVSGL